MKSAAHGRSTSRVEVTNVSSHGFWLLLGDQELFAPFKEFPWFRDASIGEITRVELPSAHHLYWPDLDVDLAVESLTHPDRYPMVSRMPPQRKAPKRLEPAARKPPARSRRRTRKALA